MDKILLLYSPKGGNVEKISKKITQLIGEDKIEKVLIEKNIDEVLKNIENYEKIIMVISTVGRSNWDSYYSKIGWDYFIPELRKKDLSGKKVSIVGLGDHLLYPDNFVDSMGILYQSLLETNSIIIGKVNSEEYTFDNSMALEGKMFVGLAIDEDNEEELTDKRLKKWKSLISEDFGL